MLAAAALLAAAPVALVAAADLPLEDLSQFPRATVEIDAAGKVHRFDVWIADTPARHSQGLMFVRDLPADAGMLFVYEQPAVIAMWMKNTYIPLDMLFVAPDGRIAHILANAKPHSLATLSSEKVVQSVVELRGGEAARRGFKVGDRVRVAK